MINEKNYSYEQINELLQDEINNCDKKPWNKLEKSVKLNKLYAYADRHCNEHGMNQIQCAVLKSFLKGCLDKKRLDSGKEIQFNKDKQIVENIPRLNYSNKRFTLKKLDKNDASTLPIRKRTVKNKEV